MPENRELGHLERELMECVWRRGESSVSDVHEQCQLGLAYTTIMTTLDRLYKKGLLDRRKESRAFLYASRGSKAEFKRGLVKRAINSLIEEHNAETAPLMASLVDTLHEYDAHLLDDLQALIQEARRRKRER